MQKWIEFYNKKLDGTIGPALGTDGFQPVDGRLNLASIKREAVKRARLLSKVQTYVAFRIMQGPLPSRTTPITPIINI